MSDEQLRHLKELAFNAVQLGHGEQNYWASVALQLIEELERERSNHTSTANVLFDAIGAKRK
jgi:hypothetical protein